MSLFKKLSNSIKGLSPVAERKKKPSSSNSPQSTSPRSPQDSPVQDAKKKNVFFGVDLQELVNREANVIQKDEDLVPQVPMLLQDLCNFLRDRDYIEVEGIFRLAASSQEILRAREAIEKADMHIFQKVSPHTLAQLVKVFFRELPVPLFPEHLQNNFYDCLKIPEENTSELLNAYRSAVQQLPSVNQATLMFLLHFLYDVSAKETTNKMSAANLAIVFTTPLFPIHSEDPQAMIKSVDFHKAILQMIKFRDALDRQVRWKTLRFLFILRHKEENSYFSPTAMPFDIFKTIVRLV